MTRPRARCPFDAGALAATLYACRQAALVGICLTVMTTTAAEAQTPGGGAGTALRFFGTGSADIDRVKIRLDGPERPVDVGATDFTIEWWMRAEAGQNGARAISPGGSSWTLGNVIIDRDIYGPGEFGDYGVSLGAGRLAFGVGTSAGDHTIVGTRNVADGAWHHVAVTRRRSDGFMAIYVDGALDASADGPNGDASYRNGRTASWANDPFLVLGAEKHDVSSAYPSFSGWLDELRVSTVLRYTGAFPRPTTPFAADGATAALYHFDEGSGTQLGDSAGAAGGPSHGQLRVGGAAAGPQWVVSTAPLQAAGAPVVAAGPDQTITLPAVARLDGTVSPATGVTIEWRMVAGPASVSFFDNAAEDTEAVFGAAGTYVLRLTAAQGQLSASDDLTVVVRAANQPPVVSAGADSAVSVSATAVLDGTVSDDGWPNPPGAVTVAWSLVSGPGAVTIANPAAIDTTVRFGAVGTYVLRLTAQDGSLSSSDDVVVTARPVNTAPTVSAGPDRTVTLPATASLDGAVADDGLPAPPGVVALTWSMVTGPAPVAFDSIAIADPVVTFTVPGTYVLRITGSDGALSASDDVAVTVGAAPPGGTPAGLLAAYTFDEGTGGTVADASGNNATLTRSGATWTTLGRFNGGMAFDGVDDRLTGPAVTLPATFTVMAWVLNPTVAPFEALVSVGTGRTLYLDANRVSYHTPQFEAVFGSAMAPGVWHHVAVTSDGTTLRAYLDGEARGQARPAVLAAATAALQVGVWPQGSGADFLSGTLDEVRIYNRALAPAEIARDMVTPIGGGPADSEPPQVVVSAPADGTVVAGTVTITAEAADDIGVVGLQFLVDGRPHGSELTAAPYWVTWNTREAASGAHVLTAVARDAAGNATTSRPVTVTLAADPVVPANLPPVVSAGPDRAVTQPAAAALDGDVSDDGRPSVPGSVTSGWTVVSGPGAVTFSSAGTADTLATFSLPGSYVLRLTASDGALSATDDVVVTVAAAPAPPTGLIAAYAFDEGTGTTVPDLSGNGVTLTRSGPSWTTQGRFNGGMAFDGVNDRLTGPAVTLPATFTMMAWFLNPTVASYEALISVGLGRALYLDASQLRFYAQPSDDAFGSAIPAGAWHHLALTSDGTTLRAYLDGEALGPGRARAVTAVTDTLVLGVWPQGAGVDYLGGTLDEVRLYNRTLSLDEIRTGMNTPVGAAPADTTPPLMSSGVPSGTVPSGTTQVTLALTTNEAASCRYGTTNAPYSTLPNAFGTAGGTLHTAALSGLTNGSAYTFFARCRDGAGNENTSSLTIGFVVALPPVADTQPPQVSLTAPADGAIVGGTITLTATASDNVGVAGVTFRLDGEPLVAERTTAPYSWTWDTRAVTAGAHVLTAVARDAAGNATISSQVWVTVDNGATAVVGLIRQSCTGFTNCYTSLAAWEAAYGGISFGACPSGDLVCANRVAVAQIDGPWTVADTTAVNISGWRTGPLNGIHVVTTPAARHGAVAATGYRMARSGLMIDVNEDYVRLEGLTFVLTATATATAVQVSSVASASNVEITGCLFIGNSPGLADGLRVTSGSSSSKNVALTNNLFRGFSGGSRAAVLVAGGSVTLSNNTIVRSRYGVRRTGGTVIARNTLSALNTTDYSGTFGSQSTNNVSGDSTAPASGTYYRQVVVTFADPSAGDYRLAATDAGARGRGANLSTLFTLDIEGQLRTAPWDVGADEVVPVP